MVVSKNSGFEFEYSKKRIGKSKSVSQDKINNIQPSKSNSESMIIYCKSCGVYMDFEVGINDMLDGLWTCPMCNSKLREKTVYTQLNRENETFLTSIDLTDDDIPACCVSCGGPWPSCQTSCKIFD